MMTPIQTIVAGALLAVQSALLLTSGDYTGDMHSVPALAQEDLPLVSSLLEVHTLLDLPTIRRNR